MPRIQYSFWVQEITDYGPEVFGRVLLDYVPMVGDVIQLKWLDGRDAYKARVESVWDDFRILVERVDA